MARRTKYQDEFEFALCDNYRRAGVTLTLAFVALLAWEVCTSVAASAGVRSVPIDGVIRLLRTWSGWSATILFPASVVQYAYAYFYPYLRIKLADKG